MLLLTELGVHAYEEIFVVTFKAYGPNEVRSMYLECHNKYFPHGPKSRLITACSCIPAQIKQYEMKLYCVGALFTVLVHCPVHTPVHTPLYGLPLMQPIRPESYLSVVCRDMVADVYFELSASSE